MTGRLATRVRVGEIDVDIGGAVAAGDVVVAAVAAKEDGEVLSIRLDSFTAVLVSGAEIIAAGAVGGATSRGRFGPPALTGRADGGGLWGRVGRFSSFGRESDPWGSSDLARRFGRAGVEGSCRSARGAVGGCLFAGGEDTGGDTG
jgi:hypothetical protein